MSIFASEIAPKGMQFNPGDFVMSDKYCTILTVISYPQIISPGYLSGLTSMTGVKIVIKHIPIPFDVIRKMLNKQLADLRSRYEEEKDRTRQEQIRLRGPFRRLRGRTLPGDRYSGCKSGPMGKSQVALSAFCCIFSPAA